MSPLLCVWWCGGCGFTWCHTRWRLVCVCNCMHVCFRLRDCSPQMLEHSGSHLVTSQHGGGWKRRSLVGSKVEVEWFDFMIPRWRNHRRICNHVLVITWTALNWLERQKTFWWKVWVCEFTACVSEWENVHTIATRKTRNMGGWVRAWESALLTLTYFA